MLIKKLSSSVTHIKSISIQICHRDINTFGEKKKTPWISEPYRCVKRQILKLVASVCFLKCARKSIHKESPAEQPVVRGILFFKKNFMWAKLLSV